MILRNVSLDIMKIILALMVVGIHTNFLAEFNGAVSYMLNQGVFRIAVPIFFIVSGYYFSTAMHSGKAKIWLIKISTLYAVWMIAYSYYWLDLGGASLFDLAKVAHTAVFGYFHLWYLPAAIGAAAMVYSLRRLSPYILFMFLVFAFVSGVLIQYLGNYHVINFLFIDKLFNMGWIYRNFIFSGFPFFALGYLLVNQSIESRITFRQSIIVSLVGIFCVALESYTNYVLVGKSESFDILISLIIACPAIFIFFKKFGLMSDGPPLSLYASGIYFIHPLIMYYFWGYGFRATTLTLVTISFSIIASACLVIINKKYKFLL